MARGDFHRIHSRDRAQHNRSRIAQEAARLMSEQGLRNYRRAKLKAAQRLGIDGEQMLPRNLEVEQALREHQRLFQAVSQPQALHHLRAAAIEAMRFFAPFRPRLVGPVLEGTADAHSPVMLHVFGDNVETFSHFLADHHIPARQQSRRVRLTRDTQVDCPLFLTAADGVSFELLLLAPELLRQAPLDPVRDGPMARASLAALAAMHEQTPTAD